MTAVLAAASTVIPQLLNFPCEGTQMPERPLMKKFRQKSLDSAAHVRGWRWKFNDLPADCDDFGPLLASERHIAWAMNAPGEEVTL
jgi:hypothetical protein